MQIGSASRITCAFTLACSLSCPALATQLPHFTNLYVFGDSLSDTGNVYRMTRQPGPLGDALPDFPRPPYYEGRFSNGYNYVDRLSQRLGIDVTPSLDGGTDYAVGGAMTGLGNSVLPPAAGIPPTGLQAQYANYLAQPGEVDPGALYVVYGGANDMFALLRELPSRDPSTWEAFLQQGVDTAAGNVSDIVSGLLQQGAEHVLVPNLPDIGLTPTLSGSGLEALASATTQSFNALLANRMAPIASDVVQLDVYGLVQAAVAQPSRFGLTEVTQACYPDGLSDHPSTTPCADPEHYLFWDEMHPTAQAHAFLALAAEQALAVPEPRGVALLSVVLVAVWAARHMRNG